MDWTGSEIKGDFEMVIETMYLRVLALTMSKNDASLAGVFFASDGCGKVTMMSTDTHRLTVITLDELCPECEFLVPAEIIKSVKDKKMKLVDLSGVSALQRKMPDYMRTLDAVKYPTGEAAQINIDYLVDASKAICELGVPRKWSKLLYIHHNGSGPATIDTGLDNVKIAIMPLAGRVG